MFLQEFVSKALSLSTHSIADCNFLVIMPITEQVISEFFSDLFESEKALKQDSEHFNTWRLNSTSSNAKDGLGASKRYLSHRDLQRKRTADLIRKHRKTDQFSSDRLNLNREIDFAILDLEKSRDEETRKYNKTGHPDFVPSVYSALLKFL